MLFRMSARELSVSLSILTLSKRKMILPQSNICSYFNAGFKKKDQKALFPPTGDAPLPFVYC